MKRFSTRATIAVCSAALIGVVAWAGQASAHVTVDTLGTAVQGAELTKISFAVPNESDTSGTVKIEVQMPKDTPLTFVAVEPKAGWTVTTTTRKLDTPITGDSGTIDTVVDVVTWTATGDTQIGPGQFDQFWMSVGTMPTTVTSLEFPTVQTYANGDIVRWIEPTPASGAEPEHPLPTLELLPATDAAVTPASTDDGVDALGLAALIVASLGLLAGTSALVSSRRRRTPPTAATDAPA